MALFRGFQEVTPLFRLLADDCAYNAAVRRSFPSTSRAVRAFQPRFDLREVKDTYELHGELPGVRQEDISMQWDDPQTLTITGRSERRRTEGSAPKSDESEKAVEGSVAEEKKPQHQATVEDGPDDFVNVSSSSDAAEATNTETSTPAPESSETSAPAPKSPATEKPKYWLSERTVGEFRRSWKFPGRLDQDNVHASLKDGILSVIVPKAKVVPPKKIEIE